MSDMKALMVKIGLNPNGQAKYPSFNDLVEVQNSGMDWSYYVDRRGFGWGYDRQSGHDEETLDSPRGQQWGVLIVPPAFADEAVEVFPDQCVIVSEVKLKDFWENKVTAHLAEDDIDQKAMDSLSKQIELIRDAQDAGISNVQLDGRLVSLRNRIKKALDLDDPEPGIRKNHRKKWKDFKTKFGIKIVK